MKASHGGPGNLESLAKRLNGYFLGTQGGRVPMIIMSAYYYKLRKRVNTMKTHV